MEFEKNELIFQLHQASVQLLQAPECDGPDSQPFQEYLKLQIALRDLEGATLQ